MVVFHIVTPFGIIDDGSVICNLLVSRSLTLRSEFEDFTDKFIRGDLSEFCIIVQEIIYILATDEGELIGSATLAPYAEDENCSIIQNFFIADKWRGKGYGKILMDKVCTEGLSEYIYPIDVLRIDTDSWNHAMVKIIEKQVVKNKQFTLFHRSFDLVDSTREGEAVHYNVRL
jgi:RimJ/RimL family protein N-acetyltransferase